MNGRIFGRTMMTRALAIALLSAGTWARAAEPTALSESSVSESTQKVSWTKKLRNRIASLDFGHTFNIADAEIFEGVTAALKYRYQVEPSYKGDYHLRMDRWILDLDVGPGDELADFGNAAIGLNLKKGTDIVFVRPFKDKAEAFKATPYGLDHLPFTTKRLVDKLAVGDFAAFTSQLNLVVEPSILLGAAAVPIEIATHYLLSGQFQVHVVRTAKDKVRLRLFALRKQEVGGSLTIGLAPDIKISGLKIVDKALVKVTDLTEIFKVSMSKGKSNLLMVDYVLNVGSPPVTAAYDDVLASAIEFKTLGIANPFSSNTELTDRLISDITPLENIFAKEKAKSNVDARTVDRIFKGKNDVEESVKSNFKINLLVARFGQEREYAENAMTSVDSNEAKSFFRLHTFQRTKDDGFFFSWSKSKSISRAQILFGANANLDIEDIRDIVFEWEYSDKILRGSEFEMIQEAVAQALPDGLVSQIDWKGWTSKNDYDNASFSYKMVLHPDAFKAVGNLGTANQIAERLSDYLDTIPTPSATPMAPADQTMPVFGLYTRDIEVISSKLEVVFSSDPQVTANRRAAIFAELRDSDLFIEIGPGFLVSLIPKAQLQKLVYFEMKLRADGASKVDWTSGSLKDRKIYEAASYIQAVLNGRQLELAIQNLPAPPQ